tara:strand:+ start:2446 stop:3828 length:1383 start_codon:yes stop_codon:yes gene_type:complete
MNENRQLQISRYLADELSDQEAGDLFAWVAESAENAEAFARASAIEDLTGELFQEGRFDRGQRNISRRGLSIVAPRLLLAAAAIVLSLVAIANWRHLVDGDDGFAVVAQSVGARSPEGVTFETGRRLGAERITIHQGLIRLDFDHGATMTVEGPAEFEVRDEMLVLFECGVATFEVPELAKGFTVLTPDADVVDLGTAFGLSRSDGGETDVCVFEGEVEVRGQLVREGEAVMARGQDELVETVFETGPFEKAWPISSGVLQTTGLMKFVSPGPGFVPGEFEDSERIMVFPERSGVEIESTVLVDLADPGEFRRLRRSEGIPLAKGIRVRSYLLQLDPVGQTEQRSPDKSRVRGQITFDSPIVGLIANSEKLLDSDAIFGHPLGNYGASPRGLEPPKGEPLEVAGRDIVILAADQRTLILNFAAGSAVDQLRVLVEEPDESPPLSKRALRKARKASSSTSS